MVVIFVTDRPSFAVFYSAHQNVHVPGQFVLCIKVLIVQIGFRSRYKLKVF